MQEQAHEDANIIFGASIDETLGENVKVTVIATGFDAAEREIAHEIPAQRPSLAPMTMSSPQQAPRSMTTPSSMRPSMEPAPAQSARRPVHSHEVRTQASASTIPSQRPAMRPTATQDAFPNLDHDWDVPAFQRKQR